MVIDPWTAVIVATTIGFVFGFVFAYAAIVWMLNR